MLIPAQSPRRALTILLALLAAGSAHASDVRARVSIGGEISPGVYGSIDIGNRPPPPLVYPQPVVIVQQPAVVHAAPIYLHVPPGHAKKWSKHCHKYQACNRPVYFVRSAEYDDRGRGHGRGKDGHRGHKD